MKREKLIEKVTELGPWVHQIEIAEGLRTRDIAPMPGPQPVDHPLPRWVKISTHLPRDMSGMRVLDIGCSDGFFSIEMARRGASEVVAMDAAGNSIQRLKWVANQLGITAIKPSVGNLYDLRPSIGRFDLVFCFAVLYHLRDPLTALEVLSSLGEELLLETIVEPDEQHSHLVYQPPREGKHTRRPKWFPTTRCVKDMLAWVGLTRVEEIAPPDDGRPIYIARRQ